jgi:hypothetical protein
MGDSGSMSEWIIEGYMDVPAHENADLKKVIAQAMPLDRKAQQAQPCEWCDGKQFIYDDQRKTIKIPCPRCQQAQPRCEHGKTTGHEFGRYFYCGGPVGAPQPCQDCGTEWYPDKCPHHRMLEARVAAPQKGCAE